MARSSLGPGLDGILVIDKPAGPTSHDVVALVRRLAATKRVGHGGTLDPFAGGVLPIFLGHATRVVEYHLGDTKRYRATVCFGGSSTTDDLEGEITPADGPAPSRGTVEVALATMVGPISQRPPAYSAIKVGGRRAYAMARAGETVALAEREVTLHALTMIDWDGSDLERPIAIVDVTCSAGTYVRAIARDLGESVGNAAYLGALSRTASGPFELAEAVPLDDVRAAAADGPEGLTAILRPIDDGLDVFPSIDLTETELAAVARGQFVRPSAGIPAPAAAHYRLRGPDGRLAAIATAEGTRLAPDKVFVSPAPSPNVPVAVAIATPASAGSDPADATD